MENKYSQHTNRKPKHISFDHFYECLDSVLLYQQSMTGSLRWQDSKEDKRIWGLPNICKGIESYYKHYEYISKSQLKYNFHPVSEK